MTCGHQDSNDSQNLISAGVTVLRRQRMDSSVNTVPDAPTLLAAAGVKGLAWDAEGPVACAGRPFLDRYTPCWLLRSG
jgi:hypothetical protein